MQRIRRWIANWVLKAYLDDFSSPPEDKEITEGQKASALKAVYNSKNLRDFLMIRVANLIRRNLYASNIEESSFYRGQILALRWLVRSSEEWHEGITEALKDIENINN